MNKISPFLWFDHQAEQAMEFYATVFPSVTRHSEIRWPENSAGPAGGLLVAELEIEGQRMTFMNGGPGHPLTEAFSFYVRCDTQEEIDGYWEKFLSAGASEMACGWLRDQFGLCWQITPREIGKWVSTPGGMKAMMGMKKLIIAELKAGAGVV